MPEPTNNVDGIGPSTKEAPTDTQKTQTKKPDPVLARARFALLTLIGLPYLIYVFWSFFLLAVLPNASGEFESLIPFAKLIAMIAGIVFVLGTLFAVSRIGKASKTADRFRYGGFIRIAIIALPGIALSGFVPYHIQQEPSLSVYVTNPPQGTELVAPLSISFDASDAVSILGRRGLKVDTFLWDFNGDRQTDLESVVPDAVAYYDKQGGYDLRLTLKLSDGSDRLLRRRIVVPKAVFSYTPFVPVVDEPIVFSVAHLLPPQEEAIVRSIDWDFNEDDVPDIQTIEPDVTHTFLTTGLHTVSVLISFTNQTQTTYTRVINVEAPRPNPFPIEIETTPQFLESPAPFQVVFTLKTDEELQEVTWDFGDSTPEEKGQRIGHTFRNNRSYQVRATARSVSGQIAKASTVVKVVERLDIPDLSFEGSAVNRDRIQAEAPVSIDLTPKTTVPLIDFWWETPENASEVTSTDGNLKAIFREEGTYNLVLLGKDAEGRVMRRTIVLEVQPRAEVVNFEVRPEQAVAPAIMQFDASQSNIPGEVITGFLWNFGDTLDDEFKFGDAFEEYEYTTPGQYQVTLMVNTLSGRTETARKSIVVRVPFLKACFTMSRNRIKPMQGILFKWECTTGTPTSVTWRYGDGSEAEADPLSSTKEIDHLFEKVGQYEVELVVRDANGSVSTYTQTVIVEP